MGRNTHGQLGVADTANRTSPVQVVDANVTAVAAGTYHSLFLKSDGSLHAMGMNGYGQLGDGTTTQRNSPGKSADLISTVEQAYVAETAADVTDP
jgi:alpha-tubulin suppressor-like RCC1 family protein